MAWLPTTNIALPSQPDITAWPIPWKTDSRSAVIRRLPHGTRHIKETAYALILGAAVATILSSQIELLAPRIFLGCVASITYWVFCYTVGLDRPLAAICAAVFAIHPQSVELLIGSQGNQPLTVIFLPLFVWASARTWSMTSRVSACISAFFLGISGYFVGVAVICLAMAGPFLCPSSETCRGKTSLSMIVDSALSLFLLIFGYAISVIGRQTPLKTDQNAVGSPLAWLDRQGLLREWFEALPAEFFIGEPSRYMGWSLLALVILIAIWCGALNVQMPRAISWFFTAFAALCWLGLGQRSPHRFLVEVIEAATVHRFVEPATLNLLGIVLLAVAFFGASTVIHCYRLLYIDRRQFPALILATGAIIAPWALAPLDLFTNRWLGDTTVLPCCVCRVPAG